MDITDPSTGVTYRLEREEDLKALTEARTPADALRVLRRCPVVSPAEKQAA